MTLIGIILIGIGITAALSVLVIVGICKVFSSQAEEEKLKQKIRRSVYGRRFIPRGEFESRWVVNSSAQVGYKYSGVAGCYVIAVYARPVMDGNYAGYSSIYIGQAADLCQQVHDLFNGRGNREVYEDIRNKKYIYVQLLPCAKEKLNEIEDMLHAKFTQPNSAALSEAVQVGQ